MANIKIKISEIMDKAPGGFDNETTLIRVPKLLRATLNLNIGQDLALSSINGDQVVLTVFPAYKDDALTDDKHCYVTNNVFNLINILPTTLDANPITSITLGCDPEFFLVDNETNQLLRANMFLDKWGEIGHDGILAELRPKPALHPKILTNNIYNLIKNTRNLLEQNTCGYDPSRIMLYGASSFKTKLQQQFTSSAPIYATAGFHLHFGLPTRILGISVETNNIMHKISNIMDYYVGIPSALLEQTKDYNRRSNTCVSYGKPGDYRLDQRTFEYRVPGGSLLRHPVLTEGLFTLGSIVVTDFISKLKEATNDFNDISVNNVNSIMHNGLPLYTDLPNLNKLFSIICTPSLIEARHMLEDIYKNFSKMVTFVENKDSLNNLFSLITNPEQINNNIEENWRNFYEHRPNLCGPRDASKINSTASDILETQLGTCA